MCVDFTTLTLDSGKWLTQTLKADLGHWARDSGILGAQNRDYKAESVGLRWSGLLGAMGRGTAGGASEYTPQNPGACGSSEGIH